jgi:ABC-type uncharacterized transport system substrate-binding protein
MLGLLKNLWLGLALIASASAVLLLSDLDRRDSAARKRELPRLAIMQWTSTDLLDSTVKGIVDGLRHQGFEHGRTASIRFYNAAGDISTANMMAKEIVGGAFDMVLTASTLALQSVAAANRDGKIPHVFGGVTDPYHAGVGIAGPGPEEHPAHLTGVGTFQPVDAAIRIAREMNPKLKKLGVAWNPAEDNSEACVQIARKTCKQLGIELVEATVGNTSEVAEGVRSLVARKVEAVWIGGDTVAMAAIHAILSVAREAGIPVFSNDPTDAARGALFGLGASYRDVGFIVGERGGQILRGADPASFGVDNVVPEMLSLNAEVAAALSGWTIRDEHRARAREAKGGQEERRAPQPGRTYRVGLLSFGPNPIFEMSSKGVLEGLAAAGFVVGKNLVVHEANANNEIAMLPQVIQRLTQRELDLLVALSTPCLSAVLASGSDLPVVFGVVSAPLEAGAGESFDKHLPHVTGAVWTAPSPQSFSWMNQLFPGMRRLGVLYNPAHDNSLVEVAKIREFCSEYGWELVERTVSAPSEVVEAIQSLLQAAPDVVFGMGENTVVSAFSAVAGACLAARIPLVADDASLMGGGALFSVGASPRLEGQHAGTMASRVLLGDDPGSMPFEPSVGFETAIDLGVAKQLGVALPPDFLKTGDVFYNVAGVRSRPARVVLVNLVQSRVLEDAEEGLLRGLREAGLAEDVDFTLKRYNAQGEISQLPALLDTARQQNPDAIVTITTPAMIAAANRVKDVPVVFTVSSDPVALGIFEKDALPQNLTGVHDDPPLDSLLDMAMRYDPGLKSVGIVYDPAQPNSVLSVEKLRKACAERRIKLHEATAFSMTDLSPAVQSIVQRKADALILSADNLVASGFPSIQKAAKNAGMPIFVTEPQLAEAGAAGAIGDDYEAWGAQAGRLLAKVLAGVPTSTLPLEATKVQQIVEPKAIVAAPASASPRRPHEIRIVRYNDAAFSDDAQRGFVEGLREAGWQPGRDYVLRTFNAQGDVTTLSSILSAVSAERPDLVVPISTPALQAALRLGDAFPIVFAAVGDGVLAGAGTSETDHLPNVTGITTKSPFAEMAGLIRRTMPQARKVGTLFVPSEINSELYRGWFEEALATEGLELAAVPVASSAEVSEATTALIRAGIDLIAQISDNATRPGYSQIVRRADDAGIPFFCFDGSGVAEGAALALARDFYDAGREAAAVAVAVLKGKNPASIPFANTRTETLTVNPKVMEKFGLRLPPEIAARAREYHED